MSTLVKTFTRRNVAVDPFVPTTIVVQSFGIGQWLKHEIARHDGIAANIDCILPAELIWRMYQRVLPEHKLPKDSLYSREQMTWRIMQILPKMSDSEFDSIQQYLNGSGDSQLRCYQLSDAIAGLFDQYLVYRPDWIKGWEDGNNDPEQPWQSLLWRQLIKLPGLDARQHRGRLHEEFITTLKDTLKDTTGFEPDSQLPQLTQFSVTISLFGLSSLPAIQLQALQAISKFVDIDIYFLNPCEHYWGDIVSEKDKAKRSIRKILDSSEPLTDEDYFDVGNPLLASMGKQGREYLELLLETDNIHTQEVFIERTQETVLSRIQNDILRLEYGGQWLGEETSKLSYETEDMSLHICSTHSRLREIEILYDQILDLIDRGLSPPEIIIMAPNISQYAPFIKAVFQGKLHFSITDQSLNEESVIAAAFERCLNLPDSRFTSTEIMDFLEVPAVSKKLNLSESDLELIAYWIDETGIRWELNADSKKQHWNLPAVEFNTWVFGLKRLLLGSAMSGGVFQGIAPFEISAGDTQLLGKLIGFLEMLSGYRDNLAQAKTGSQWRELILALINDLFQAEKNDELAINYLRETAINLETSLEKAHYSGEVSPKLMGYWFSKQISSKRQTKGLISGGITFANLMPMRSIPYQAICLIGMNDKEFPREDISPDFDLMQGNYRKGDRSRRQDDRYLFLEAMLSAQQYFHLSFQGRSVKDNKSRPPSSLLGELRDYLSRLYHHDFLNEHPLQPFSEKYYDPNYPRLKSYNQTWYKALLSETKPRAFIDAPLTRQQDNPLIDLEDLTSFFQHPAKYFLTKGLGIHLSLMNTDLRETESFSLDGLESYKLADSALTTMILQGSLSHWEAEIRAEGWIIEGPIGDQLIKRELAKAQAVFDKLSPHLAVPISFPVQIKLSTTTISGNLICLGNNFLDYRSGVLRERQRITVWIKHLIRNAAGYSEDTKVISRHPIKKDQAVEGIFTALDMADAKAVLNDLVEFYDKGQINPLSYLPETSAVFFKFVGEDIQQAKDKALKTYLGGQNARGEIDPYTKRIFDFPNDFTTEFQEIATKVISPMSMHWEGQG